MLKEDYKEFISLVKRMREAQKVYSETFPTGYGCYAPVELEKEVDEYLKKIEEDYDTMVVASRAEAGKEKTKTL